MLSELNSIHRMLRSKAFTLIESLLVIGFAGIILAAASAFYIVSRSTSQATQTIQDIETVRNIIERYFRGYGRPADGSMNPVLIDSGKLPSSMSVTNDVIGNVYGGRTDAVFSGNGYTLTLTSIPRDGCVTIVSGVSPVWDSVAVNSSVYQKLPMKVQEAASACPDGNSVLAFTRNYFSKNPSIALAEPYAPSASEAEPGASSTPEGSTAETLETGGSTSEDVPSGSGGTEETEPDIPDSGDADSEEVTGGADWVSETGEFYFQYIYSICVGCAQEGSDDSNVTLITTAGATLTYDNRYRDTPEVYLWVTLEGNPEGTMVPSTITKTYLSWTTQDEIVIPTNNLTISDWGLNFRYSISGRLDRRSEEQASCEDDQNGTWNEEKSICETDESQ